MRHRMGLYYLFHRHNIDGPRVCDSLRHLLLHLRGPGDAVVVFGCGCVRINCGQVAKAMGAHVVAVDTSDEKLEWAREFGADATENPSEHE